MTATVSTQPVNAYSDRIYTTSPIAVLSNNDGIIVALNAECKSLGFKRGEVFYQVKHQMEKKGVAVFSSNYTLYADMSARMNLIYNRFTPEVEIYSIDESFLFFPAWNNTDYYEIGLDLKKTVTKETGIPVSVGIAPNKVLVKLCNRLAKKRDSPSREYAAGARSIRMKNFLNTLLPIFGASAIQKPLFLNGRELQQR